MSKLENEGSTLRILEHFRAFWNEAQTAAMPSFEHYNCQTGKAKPETPAVGVLYIRKMQPFHRHLVGMSEKYKMITKEDTWSLLVSCFLM